MRFPLILLSTIAILHLVTPPIARAQAPDRIELQELWRVGGDEELLFGVVSGIEVDDAGAVYVLDRQLCQVQRFSPEGEHLATLGREGEGPGEFRRPGGLILTPEGNVGVMMAMPGRIVVLSPEGDPLDDLPLPESPEGQVLTLGGVRCRGGNLVIYDFERVFADDVVDQDIYLQKVEADGSAGVRYHHMHVRDVPNQMVLDETERGEVLQRWGLGPNGRVWFADGYTEYNLRVWNPDGSVARVIHRDYEPHRRTKEEIAARTDLLRSFTRNWPANTRVEVSEFHLSVRGFQVRADGSCWVLTSRGLYDRPGGSLGTWEVWDADGRFQRSVTLVGEGDPERDAIYFRGDRVFVVRGALDSRLSAAGGAIGSAADEVEAPELEVVCCRLAPD